MDLRNALKKGDLRQFLAERKGETGDSEAFDATLSSMVGKSKSGQKTSSRDDCDD